MGLEEQKEEREVLDSIFPDEITDISETSYRVSITLDVQENETEEDSPTILLSVTYPDKYPDVGPYLDVSAPPNAPKYTHLDVQSDKDQLLESLQTTIEESLGMAMVFTLVATLKESAEALINERKQVVEQAKESEKRKVEEEENRKFHGTSVTRERFIAWRQKFKAEMDERAKKEKEEEESSMTAEEKRKRLAGGGKEGDRKFSGKQLWEKGLVGKVDDEDVAADVDEISHGVSNVKVES